MVKGRQYNSLCVYMPCLNHRDKLDRSTLDRDSRQKRQIDVSVTKTNSTAHAARVSRMRIACMNVCVLMVLYIALALLFIHGIT